MRKKHSTNRAILVLESPWELDDADSNRSSVLPFVNGVAKLVGDTEVYHANFYDKSSFKKALASLTKVKFNNTIVYVAAHGYKRKIGNVNIDDLLFEIGQVSREFNITGLMLGSCFVGGNTITMSVYIEGTNLKWCGGYSSDTDWLVGTMIDCSVIARMSECDVEDFSDEVILASQFDLALSPFNKYHIIGENYNGNPISIVESMQFAIQATGKGKRAQIIKLLTEDN